MPPHTTDLGRLKQMANDMTVPGSPTELLKAVTSDRARQIFEDFDAFSPFMKEQARLLMKMALDGELSDLTFQTLVVLTLHLWRDCNQARFHALKRESNEPAAHMLRTVQIDQFLNGLLISLDGIETLMADTYCVEEPEGS